MSYGFRRHVLQQERDASTAESRFDNKPVIAKNKRAVYIKDDLLTIFFELPTIDLTTGETAADTGIVEKVARVLGTEVFAIPGVATMLAVITSLCARQSCPAPGFPRAACRHRHPSRQYR